MNRRTESWYSGDTILSSLRLEAEMRMVSPDSQKTPGNVEILGKSTKANQSR